MEKIILYVDDAAYAREFLARATADQVGGDGARHWMLVACAPRMTHRISKWVSHSARENWRGNWFAETQDQVVPLLSRPGDAVTPMLAQGPLADLTLRLKRDHGAGVRVVDARRPKIGVELNRWLRPSPPHRRRARGQGRLVVPRRGDGPGRPVRARQRPGRIDPVPGWRDRPGRDPVMRLCDSS